MQSVSYGESYADYEKRENKQNNQWRCRDRNCSSTISVCSQDLSIIKNETTHTCAQDTNKFIVDTIIERMQKRAREETATIPKIYSQEIVKARVENPGLPTGSLFPTVSNIDAALYRRCAINYPKLPTTINEISLNGSWKSDKNGGDFLLVDETCK
ncbi:unnamed protein product [Didymodactylos carnosus]|uniref:FLYWCH-type domain-containing protein n=1 Tax=Didymodactylos carnosus TaxID=1234261 RepID=A0A815YRL4_9BILA|nr:unnamed protein product [Didymodactylos carnosus]CAF4438333.1 unnamed protein product [Didymodactylos carnosus]